MKRIVKLTILTISVLMIVNLSGYTQDKNEIPITSNSKEAIKLFKEGRVLAENVKYIEANKKFDEAIALDPNFAYAYLFKVYGGNYEDQIANIKKALDLLDYVSDGEKLDILFTKASFDGDWNKQKEYLDQLLELYPKDKRVLLNYGLYYYQLKNYEKALDFYNRALNVDKNYAPAVNMIANSYLKLEQFNKAEEYYKKNIDLLPNDAAPYDSYADFLFQKGRYDDAVTNYKKALEKDENYYYPIRKIGATYIMKKDYSKAREYFEKYFLVATQQNSKFLGLDLLAMTYLYESDKENAMKVYDRYIQFAQQNKSAFNELWGNASKGYILTCCGDPEQGLKFFEKALSIINSSNLEEGQAYFMKMNAIIWKSLAYCELGDFENTENELNKCVQLNEKLNNPFIKNWLNLVQAYENIKKQNYDTALNLLEKINMNDPILKYYKAQAYMLKGDVENAKKYYQDFLDDKNIVINSALFYNKAEKSLSELKL